SMPSSFEIAYALRRVAFLLPEKKQAELRALLRQDRPENVERAISEALRVVRSSRKAREWLEHALYFSGEKLGHAGLPGQPTQIPARSLWKCPQCDFTWRVLRKGRPVPPCPYDGSVLVRVSSPEEKNNAG
ncbi:MAG: hypothetical protein NZL98_07495, partial [Anaerolineales bacterium]|nr:hypothetical protein [Anaerolineales bacterium]MDW8227443.1 hypothetical protein [Anaerolineales bacterium]